MQLNPAQPDVIFQRIYNGIYPDSVFFISQINKCG